MFSLFVTACFSYIVVIVFKTPASRSAFHSNFRNGGKWYKNSFRKFPENPKMLKFLTCEPFNRKFRKSNGTEIPSRKFSKIWVNFEWNAFHSTKSSTLNVRKLPAKWKISSGTSQGIPKFSKTFYHEFPFSENFRLSGSHF